MKSFSLKEIGERIYERRRFLGLTQEQLAEQMDVSIQMISNLERGNKAIKIDNLLKLCEILDVSTDYILTGTKNESELSGKLKELSQRDYKLISQTVDFLLSNS